MYPILLTLGENIDKVFSSFDLWVFHFFGSMQCTFLTYVAKFFTTFGDEGFIIPLVVVGAVLCLFKRTRKFGLSLIFAVVIGTLVTNIVVKPMALRVRPYNTLQGNADYWKWYIGAGALSESDYSFPSGHTTGAFEIATALFLCFKKSSYIGFVIISQARILLISYLIIRKHACDNYNFGFRTALLNIFDDIFNIGTKCCSVGNDSVVHSEGEYDEIRILVTNFYII